MLRKIGPMQQENMKKGSPTMWRTSLVCLFFVALMCFVDLFLAFMEGVVHDWEQGPFIIEMGVLVIAVLLPTMCLSIASWHKKAAKRDAHEVCDDKKKLTHDHQYVATIAAGIHQVGLACRTRMTANRQLQDIKKNSPSKLRPLLMLLFFLALTCFVDVLVALMEELIFKTKHRSFMTETQVVVIAMLLLITMCLSNASWHKIPAQKDAHKDLDDKNNLVYDQQEDATVAKAEHALQNVMDQGNVDARNAAFSAAVTAVAKKYASANDADVYPVGQRRAKQLQLERQAAEEQRGTRRHRQQQEQLQQQQQGRQQLQQQWAPLPPQSQPGVCVQEPQLVMQNQHRKSAPSYRSSNQTLYVKARVKPSRFGAG